MACRPRANPGLVPVNLTPDGTRYLAMGRGRPAPKPFHLRWLMPWLCRDVYRRWMTATAVSWILAAIGTAFLADGWERGVAAAVMFAALPGMRCLLRCPVTVDLPALACAVWAAVAWGHGLSAVAVLLVVVGAACKESAPVFAALFAWTPVLLVGLVVVAIRWAFWRPCAVAHDPMRAFPSNTSHAEHAWILEHPFAAGWKYHRQKLFDGLTMVTPWGAAIVALAGLDVQLGVLLLVAYGQLAVATDSVRLYQWAAPLMCVVACTVVPVAWLPVLVVVTVWNPLAGNGV